MPIRIQSPNFLDFGDTAMVWLSDQDMEGFFL